jgi:uncharacterized membrane protein YesL
MAIQIENIVIMPFVMVFFICWFAFVLLLMFKPQAWFDFQNRHSRKYGFEWHIVDEQKFVAIHKRVGGWLIVLGICSLLIVLGYIIGFIPIVR